MTVSVVIPAYNDEQALPLVLQELPRDRVSHIIVVDNGSTDRTFAVAQAAGVMVVFEPRRGYGQACQSGLRVVAPDTDVVVFLGADHADFPDDLPAVLAPIERGEADLVIGSRILGFAEAVPPPRHGTSSTAWTVPSRSPDELTPPQRFGNWLACRLIALRFGRRFTDLGPFRAIRKEALARLGLQDHADGWNVEMQVKALKAGLRVVEVPVRCRTRLGGSDRSGTISGTMKAGAGIVAAIARHSW